MEHTASRFWPELGEMNRQRRLVAMADLLVIGITTPLVIAGLVWLGMESNRSVLQQSWSSLFLMGALMVLFARVSYFMIVEILDNRYGSADGSFTAMIQWSAVLVFGPTALWLGVLWSTLNHLKNLRQKTSTTVRWSQVRDLLLDMATYTLGFLIPLAFYRRVGGSLPFAELTLAGLAPALGMLLIQFGTQALILSSYVLCSIRIQKTVEPSASGSGILKFMFVAMGLPYLSYPFGVLAAGLFVLHGSGLYLFFTLGLLIVAILARQLSWAVEGGRQQSRQLRRLEHLGRDLINAPPDATRLADLLEKHVPSMLPPGQIAIWLAPGQLLFKHPKDWQPELLPLWQWILVKNEAAAFRAEDPLPWDRGGNTSSDRNPLVIVPIQDVETARLIGLIYLHLRSLAQPWDLRSLNALFPSMQTLAAQVASALHQAEVYEDTLAYQQAVQELEFAGRIQASFLPSDMPHLEGWQLAVTLLPARETSGDFFDFIPLSYGRIGILIADVADKGVGAALYMALSRTLLRTYALEYESQPEIVVLAANERILQDADANLFITAFYGILDPRTGTLTYCNAGHNPPYLLSPDGSVGALGATGMPIGIDETTSWTQGTVAIKPGDLLLLYTDGIPDAQNPQGEFFRETELVEAARASQAQSAQELHDCILEVVDSFVAGAPQFDDITLLVLGRELASE